MVRALPLHLRSAAPSGTSAPAMVSIPYVCFPPRYATSTSPEVRSSRKIATDLTIRYRPRAVPSIEAVPLTGKPPMSTVALSGDSWRPISRQPPSLKVRSNASRPENRTFSTLPPRVASVDCSRHRPAGQSAAAVAGLRVADGLAAAGSAARADDDGAAPG